LGWHPVPGVPRFGSDRQKVVEAALEHLRERGLTEFAYCGFSRLGFSVVRGALFVAHAATLGFRVQVYEEPGRSHARLATLETERQLQVRRVAGWLKSLPKPVGLFACNDMCARQVLNACQDAEIKVPDEIVVLGVNNDEVLCELSSRASS
jgi:LacI family transcriptional regulator